MKLIELHILQSYPVSCLNRDDVGSPKTALFGGTSRARISSQCLKRATRMAARELMPDQFQGIRTRLIRPLFADALAEAGVDTARAAELSETICTTFSKLGRDAGQVTTAVYLSPGEIRDIAVALAEGVEPAKAAKKAVRLDAADIALFGRMVANDPSLNIEGAAMFSHALSTHKAVNEVDFYSAVDDEKTEADDAGAGMIGTLEYTSATYYRYCAINLDLLNRPSHLGEIEVGDRREIVSTFIRSVITSVPGARKNSMNAATLPHEVLGVVKERGQPIQLINAFEAPVRANGSGYAMLSAEAMKGELERLRKVWGIEHAEECWLTQVGLDSFLETVARHVG